MILIASLAPGMAVLGAGGRQIWGYWRTLNWTHLTSPLWADTPYAWSSWSSLKSVILYGLGYAASSLLGPTIAQVVLRMRRPRPPDQRIASQPGFIACLSAIVMLTVMVTWGVNAGGMGRTTAAIWASLPALAVAAAWSGMAILRRWLPERSWIDVLGRGLGVSWILLSGGLALALYVLLDG
jgi:hypothetical protein